MIEDYSNISSRDCGNATTHNLLRNGLFEKMQ